VSLRIRLFISVLAFLTPGLFAQTQGTYTVFGTGCPGTGGSSVK